jgi:hypothetical protein
MSRARTLADLLDSSGDVKSANLDNVAITNLSSTASGIDVTGSVTADGLTVDSGTVDTVARFESSGDAKAYIIVKDSGSSGGAFFGADGTHTIIGTGGSDERMRITSTGNVEMYGGLDVNGEVTISPNTAGKDTIKFTTNASNDGRLLIKSDTTTTVDIQANGDSWFKGGNVGIGTSSPDNMLHVYKEASISSHNYTNYPLKIESKDTGGDFWNNQGAGIQFENTASSGSFISAEIVGETSGADGTKGELVFKTSTSSTPAEHMRITSTGNVEVSTGNLVIGTAGKGIDFSAQTATATGTTTSEILDSYEEGTWTPIVQLGGISIYVNYAKYVKIGKKVTVQLFYQTSGTGSSARLEIKGLPFNTESLGYATCIADTGGNDPHMCRTQSSSDYIIFKKATMNTWASGAALDTGHLILTLTYFV